MRGFGRTGTEPRPAAAGDRIARFLVETGLDGEGVRPDMVRDLGDGTYAAIKPLLFHWTLLRGDFDDLAGYFDRWCFADEALARAALESFPEAPPAGWEPAGWHRHPRSGRRRPEGRPEAEYLEP